MPNQIDPLDGPKFAIEGRVVTMNDARDVIASGRVIIDAGDIVSVGDANDPLPADFGDAPVLKTAGTIYPGLIELHNHLSYDILPMWRVPKKFQNRDQWGGRPDYQQLITRPMGVLGKMAGFIEAVVRYVEIKCLMGGTTTSQGIKLASNQGIQHHYRGLVRNVEQTADSALPNADGHIADVAPGGAEAFLSNLNDSSTVLLHLSEGVGPTARKKFQNLRIPPRSWAITPALAGIHCTGLLTSDMRRMAKGGGSMVWSPFSNLLLYSRTADLGAALGAKVLMGLGSDWSPSGSKNLLAELKVAAAYNATLADDVAMQPVDLVALVTINAARMLKWDTALGSIEPNKRADLLVIDGQDRGDYEQLISARETDVSLVVINGVARYGLPSMLSPFAGAVESLQVGGGERSLFLAQSTGDPIVGELTLAEASSRLADGLQRLPDLGSAAPAGPLAAGSLGLEAPGHPGQWVLELDHNEGSPLAAPMAAQPLPLVPVKLDPLTVVDDPDYLASVDAQLNLPQPVKDALAAAYG
jgi:hypothetical protein